MTALFLAGALTASSALADDRAFSDTRQFADTSLQRCGTGELEAYRIFTVGYSALYRKDCTRDWTMPMDEPGYIEFRYKREIPARGFREAAEAMLSDNIADAGLRASIPQQLKDFHAAYRAVKPGDLYAIGYQPGTGLTLLLNGEKLGALSDGPLASNYFAIWLGSSPFDEDLKASLLGP